MRFVNLVRVAGCGRPGKTSKKAILKHLKNIHRWHTFGAPFSHFWRTFALPYKLLPLPFVAPFIFDIQP